ncbi:hypothetical protein OROGR_027576 [Orobanche gracilis]
MMEKSKMLRSLFLVFLLSNSTFAHKPALTNLPTASQIPAPAKNWTTLSGKEPLVIACGGFTGLFPEGSPEAIGISKDISIFLCNLQWTKDSGAFCVTGIKLDNATNIAMFDPKEKTYNINGKDVQGHFAVDYTGAQIDHNVSRMTYGRYGGYKGKPGAIKLPLCVRSRERPDPLCGSNVGRLTLHFCKRLIPRLEPVTTKSHSSNLAVAPKLAHYGKLTQAIYSRPSFYDGMSPVLNVDGLLSGKSPPRFWLNVQYEAFYNQRGIKLVDNVQELLRLYQIEFVSSPEIGFLKSINGKVKKGIKVIFQFLNADDVEPTTKQPYSAIVKDLMAIKSYASGIMVPKQYIWPVKPDKYLGPPTTLVSDAHKLGLEVYASGFANDYFSSYSYNYDPSAEYLQFIEKGESVDGIVTDFAPTAFNAIACFVQNNTLPRKGQALIISNNGASGVYSGSTDLAYQQAIDDGADIIDCSVQMTKDGTAFCSNSIDLIGDTNAMTKFKSRSSNIPELQPKVGIFSFDLTWNEIQTLQPQTVSPQGQDFQRNPAKKNSGKFVTLPDFLELAKEKAVTGILVNIKVSTNSMFESPSFSSESILKLRSYSEKLLPIINAAYLASKKGLDIVGAVSTSLSNTTFDKQVTQQVFIQSDDTSVLSKYKGIRSYKRVLVVENKIGNAPKPTVDEIKKFAEAVNLLKSSVIKASGSMLTDMTKIVKELKDANLTVFVHTLRNEFISLAFDYWSDPNVEIATYIHSAKVDGIVTDFPATASRYFRSQCSDPKSVPTILPAKPGELQSTVPPELLPPAEAPLPPLEAGNVVDPPLPAVTDVNRTSPAATPAPPSPPSSAWTNAANSGLSFVAIVVFATLCACH